MGRDTDVRETPQDLFQIFDDIFKFQLDVCANAENAKCEKFFSEEDNGLEWGWGKCNWMNPPYSRGSLAAWLKKATEQQEKGRTTVALVPGDTSTNWYQKYILANPRVRVLQLSKRVKFDGISQGAKFCSHIVIFFGSNPYF